MDATSAWLRLNAAMPLLRCRSSNWTNALASERICIACILLCCTAVSSKTSCLALCTSCSTCARAAASRFSAASTFSFHARHSSSRRRTARCRFLSDCSLSAVLAEDLPTVGCGSSAIGVTSIGRSSAICTCRARFSADSCAACSAEFNLSRMASSWRLSATMAVSFCRVGPAV